jgi:hypothetical protein
MTDPILLELQAVESRLGSRIEHIEGKLDKVRTQDLPGVQTMIATIRTEMRLRVWVWSLVGGAIPAVGAIVFLLLKARL